jgi:hypothetical protein
MRKFLAMLWNRQNTLFSRETVPLKYFQEQLHVGKPLKNNFTVQQKPCKIDQISLQGFQLCKSIGTFLKNSYKKCVLLSFLSC